MEQNNFDNIPSLADEQGLREILGQQQAQAIAPNMPFPSTQPAPGSGAPTSQEVVNQLGAGNGAPAQPVQPTQQAGYSPEQLAAAVEQVLAAREARLATTRQQPAPQPQHTQGNFGVQGATPQQNAIIADLLSRGVSPERIAAAMRGSQAQPQVNPQTAQIQQQIAEIRAYLAAQQTSKEEAEFTDRLSSFGNKYGLSEQDLYTFGDKALQMGINLLTVRDMEAVFRGLYPEQYALRVRRAGMQPTSSPIIGGGSVGPMPMDQDKLATQIADAYIKSQQLGNRNPYPSK